MDNLKIADACPIFQVAHEAESDSNPSENNDVTQKVSLQMLNSPRYRFLYDWSNSYIVVSHLANNYFKEEGLHNINNDGGHESSSNSFLVAPNAIYSRPPFIPRQR